MDLFDKLFVLSFICLLCFNLQLNAEVYKWVDDKGKVHYSDKPIDDNAKKITVNKAPSEQQKQAAQLNANRLIERENRRRENQVEDQQDLKKQNAEKHKINKQCLEAKNELEILMTPVPVFHEDDKGNKQFLSDEARKKEIELFKESIKNHCSD